MVEEIFDEAFVEEVMDLSVPMDTAPILPPPAIPSASSPIGSTVQLNLAGQLVLSSCPPAQPWEKGRTTRLFALKVDVPDWKFPMFPSFEGRLRIELVDATLQVQPVKLQIEYVDQPNSSAKANPGGVARGNVVELDKNGAINLNITILSSLEDPTKVLMFRFTAEDVDVLIVNQSVTGQLQVLRIPIIVTDVYSPRLTIVTYPTTQWLPAMKKLITSDLEFETTPIVTRDKFALTIDAYIKWATAITDRNGEVVQQRGLLQSDIDYFLTNFFAESPATPNRMVSSSDGFEDESSTLAASAAPNIVLDAAHFENFWNFFGPVLNTLHFKKGMKKLWCDGMILGFLDKRVAAKFLEEQPPGTFLIRFSERSPGSVSLPCRDTENIWQLFVPEKDMTQTKGLGDIVRNRTELREIIHFGENCKLFRSNKDALFGEPVELFVPAGYVRAT